MTAEMTPELAHRNRMKLLVLILVPFVLMLLAWAIFFSGVGMPTGTSNKGDLINPPLQINQLAADPTQPWVSSDNTNWFFILRGASQCDTACTERLYQTRQIRTALGKHSHKIQRLYLKDKAGTLGPDLSALLAQEHPDVLVYDIEPSAWQALVTGNSVAASSDASQGFYLADFRGFMMMYYGSEHSYKDTMKDVKFLLKYAP